MPPKKVTGAAAQAKEAKEKKPAAAAPSHGKYKGMFCSLYRYRIDAKATLSLSRVNADRVCQI
jgi:hypothetical protein